ncbi:hypothetical protein D3C78_1752010 [compost metagenome]
MADVHFAVEVGKPVANCLIVFFFTFPEAFRHFRCCKHQFDQPCALHQQQRSAVPGLVSIALIVDMIRFGIQRDTVTGDVAGLVLLKHRLPTLVAFFDADQFFD